jgi:hypothetical protein
LQIEKFSLKAAFFLVFVNNTLDNFLPTSPHIHIKHLVTMGCGPSRPVTGSKKASVPVFLRAPPAIAPVPSPTVRARSYIHRPPTPHPLPQRDFSNQRLTPLAKADTIKGEDYLNTSSAKDKSKPEGPTEKRPASPLYRVSDTGSIEAFYEPVETHGPNNGISPRTNFAVGSSSPAGPVLVAPRPMLGREQSIKWSDGYLSAGSIGSGDDEKKVGNKDGTKKGETEKGSNSS